MPTAPSGMIHQVAWIRVQIPERVVLGMEELCEVRFCLFFP